MRSSDEYVNIGKFPHVKVDLRYATTNNFTGEVLYDDSFQQALLHRDAAEKLSRATAVLQIKMPGWSFLVLDALRPLSVQRRMWSYVEGTPQQIYVANPERGSIHNFGLAIDLTLVDEQGHEVDMGTPFDCFEEMAQPRFEDQFLTEGRLSQEQVNRRKLLRETMLAAGFLAIPHEWWHFNAVEIVEARRHYTMIE
jgi:D-alanyl-D-alanine dipeptidase